MKAVIIDDEKRNIKLISDLIGLHCSSVAIVGSANSKAEALEVINDTKPDIIFLDIQLAGETGFDILDALPKRSFEIIFITAYNEYAIKAFKYSATDYLLKPVDPDLLCDAVDKASANMKNSRGMERYEILYNSIQTGVCDRIAIPTQYSIEVFRLDEIIRIEADGRYSIIYLINNSSFLVTKNLGEISSVLAQTFFRAHKSHLININYVKRYLKDGNIEMVNGEMIPLSSKNKGDFLKAINL